MHIREFAVVLLVFAPTCALAEFNLEARSDIERWNAGFGGSENGLWGSVGAQYTRGNLQGAVGFGTSLGTYKLENTPDSTISRRELDLLAGYQLTRNWSAFGGYRLFRVEYASSDASRDFIDNIHGVGGGASYGIGLSPKIAGFAVAQASAVVAAIDYETGPPTDRGRGWSLGSEFGIAYRLTSTLHAVASVKYHTMNIDYGDVEWNNNYTRLGARLNYRF